MHTCVATTIFNFIAIFYLVVTTESIPVDSGCKTAVSIFSRDGVYIEPVNKSLVELSALRWRFKTGHEMKFEFRTTSQNGVLFYLTDDSKRANEMVALDIINGHPRYHIRCRELAAKLTISRLRVDDGEWHKIVFRRKNNRGKLIVDRQPFFHDYRMNCGPFTSLTFGGVNQLPKYDIIRREVNTRRNHFEGCIRNVDVSTGVERAKYHDVSGCS